jgi:hypothetical protein
VIFWPVRAIFHGVEFSIDPTASLKPRGTKEYSILVVLLEFSAVLDLIATPGCDSVSSCLSMLQMMCLEPR